MAEVKFSYNPFTGQFLHGGLFHADDIRKAGAQRAYDDFIRGIIADGVLYLRLYYPFPGLEDLSLEDLNRKSFDLLFEHKREILKHIKKILGLKIVDVKFNVTNDLLRGWGFGRT